MTFWRKLKYLVPSRRRAEERDMREELDSLAAMAEPKELGNITRAAEDARAVWTWSIVEQFFRDAHYAARTMRANPGFTVTAVLSLALSIGANTAIFSVVDAVLLNPSPYPDAGRLTVLWEQNPGRYWFRNIVSAANFVDWKKQSESFTTMAALSEASFDISGTGEPMEIPGEQVSSDFFHVVGIRPAIGRAFTPDDDRPEGSRVVILSHKLWKERYGGDPSLIGRDVTINQRRFTVIGVMPPEFYFPPWTSAAQRAQLWTTGLDLRRPDRTWHSYESIGRLKSGVPLKQAQAEMDAIARRLEAQYPEQKGWGVQLISLHDQVVGDTRPALLVLIAAVGMVLLIACANLANLQLARVAAREKEIAVRAALGGGRFRVVRQLLTESVLLAIAGGGFGLVVAEWGVRLFVALGPSGTPGLSQASVNFKVLAFTSALSVMTGIFFGLVPALNATRVDLNQCFREDSRGATQGRRGRRFRSVLVCGEFAIALVLLAGAGLLIRSFAVLSRVDLGFDPRNVLTTRIALLGANYAKQARKIDFFRRLLLGIESLPGVTAAAAIDGEGLPPVGGSGMDFLIEGRPIPPESDRPDGSYRAVSLSYFQAMRIPLVQGRYFTEADNEVSGRVAMINEKLARDYWPGQSPIGSRILFPGLSEAAAEAGTLANAKEPVWHTIVGVVKTSKNRGVDVSGIEEIYVPYNQPPVWFTPSYLLVRASGNPLALTSAIRRQVEALDRDQPISEVRLLDEIVAENEAGRRFPMLLLSLFAGLALALAGVGIYGVMSYTVTQRTHEIGIRMALGARDRDVIKAAVFEALRMAGVGVAIGLTGAVVLTRFMSRLLFGVGAVDPRTFLAVSLILLAIGMSAILIPVRRAARIDPLAALRYE